MRLDEIMNQTEQKNQRRRAFAMAAAAVSFAAFAAIVAAALASAPENLRVGNTELVIAGPLKQAVAATDWKDRIVNLARIEELTAAGYGD